jgi:predicted nucleic-acid-binding Zn-ribbon protein
MRASGGALSAIFDVSNRQFTTVTCTRCQYTEFYRTDARSIDKVLDFIAT